jgi:hypothetical protein
MNKEAEKEKGGLGEIGIGSGFSRPGSKRMSTSRHISPARRVNGEEAGEQTLQLPGNNMYAPAEGV